MNTTEFEIKFVCNKKEHNIKLFYINEPAYGTGRSTISGLPELSGTEKQIKWAEQIRKDILLKMFEKYNFYFKHKVVKYYNDKNKTIKMDKKFEDMITEYASTLEATDWIEIRDKNNIPSACLLIWVG